jgi:two-component system CheB/CheR fusion protein
MTTRWPLDADPSTSARSPLRPLRLIVADDERDTVLTLMVILRHEGHSVKGVHSGEEVLAAAAEEKPDAVILDIGMPGQSGYTVAQELRKRFPAGQGPLLIAISGKWVKPSDRMLARLAGFDHHLLKPCEPQQLLELLAPLRLPLPR